jgi:ketosteroid isomerase-like protein
MSGTSPQGDHCSASLPSAGGSADHIGLVERCYAVYTRGQLDEFFSHISDDVEWIDYGYRNLHNGGIFRGKAQMREFFQKVAATVKFTGFEQRKYLHDGESVVLLGRFSGTVPQTGRDFVSEAAFVWTFRDGKVIRYHAHVDTEALARALPPPRAG